MATSTLLPLAGTEAALAIALSLARLRNNAMYTQEQLEAMSSSDLNRLVAEKEGFSTDNGYGFIDADGNVVCYDVISPLGGETCEVEVRKNYCNSWVDMGPIAHSNEISISPRYEKNPDSLAFEIKGWVSESVHSFCDGIIQSNPLRAAAIVYLMME